MHHKPGSKQWKINKLRETNTIEVYKQKHNNRQLHISYISKMCLQIELSTELYGAKY